MVAQLVLRDPPQPAAERVPLALLTKTPDVCHHGLKDFLKDVGDIVVLQAPTPAPMQDQRGIEVDQTLPGVRLVCLDPCQQAPRGRRRRRRPSLSLGDIASCRHESGCGRGLAPSSSLRKALPGLLFMLAEGGHGSKGSEARGTPSPPS